MEKEMEKEKGSEKEMEKEKEKEKEKKKKANKILARKAHLTARKKDCVARHGEERERERVSKEKDEECDEYSHGSCI